MDFKFQGHLENINYKNMSERVCHVHHLAIKLISNGNRTEWNPIQSVIIRVSNKIGRPRRNYNALLRDVFLTIYSKKTNTVSPPIIICIFHLTYNSKMMEIDPINTLMKLSKSLCTFTASVYLFYSSASARSIIITICNF